MGMASFRSVASCVLPLILTAGPLLGADSGAAMLNTSGAAWLNGVHVPASSAVFSGDMIQTRADSPANIHSPGSSITVLGDSLVRFQGTSLTVKRGGVSVATSKGLATVAGAVRVSPASNAWTEFNVTDTDGTVSIIAQKGDLTVTDDQGTSTLAQGQATTRDDQSDASDSDGKKNRKRRAGVVPAATNGTLNSPVAILTGAGAITALTVWALWRSDQPASPSTP